MSWEYIPSPAREFPVVVISAVEEKYEGLKLKVEKVSVDSEREQ